MAVVVMNQNPKHDETLQSSFSFWSNTAAYGMQVTLCTMCPAERAAYQGAKLYAFVQSCVCPIQRGPLLCTWLLAAGAALAYGAYLFEILTGTQVYASAGQAYR